ncbi:MAG TPA: D-alanyl-D-alanine carboxypeptidase family protein [Blastocatellia bacterium]|nr:D-alanyl-D-alanine carboxypeptidase family protein [Blastocatellia bacterium]
MKSEAIVRLSSAEKPAAEATTKSAAFESAALENLRTQSDLNWAFGGKSQRGWRLYTPLVSRMLDVNEDAKSADFALAVSRWQKEKGLAAHGVVDNTTWFQMVSDWQSDRIKDRTYPTDDQLVTIPVSECYDPSRPEELRKVEGETYLAYKRMIQAAARDASLGLDVNESGELASGEKYLKIISAFRSREYQNHLRKQSPNSGRAGLAVNSPHFTGRALDIYVGGEPVSTKDDNRAIQTETRVYRWLVKNAARFGFRPYFYEPWHWEYVGQK